MTTKDTFYFDLRVYAEDTDIMGIVYHANYLGFFERARTEMIRNVGFSLSTLASYDCNFAITEAELKYRYPAYLDDLLRVGTKIGSKKSCSIVFDQVIHNQHNKLLCEAQIKVACIDKKMKPRRIPENLF